MINIDQLYNSGYSIFLYVFIFHSKLNIHSRTGNKAIKMWSQQTDGELLTRTNVKSRSGFHFKENKDGERGEDFYYFIIFFRGGGGMGLYTLS